MASVPGFDVNLRPQLPQVFPDEEITVDAEEKVFVVSETNTGSEATLSYILDKAPVSRVENVQGTDSSGENRTFTQGTDYVLQDAVLSFDETFTYSSLQDEYELDRSADSGTVSIIDERGTTYTKGVEFDVDGSLSPITDSIVWQDGEANPAVDDTFTVSYDATFVNSELRWLESGDNLPSSNSTFFVTYVAESVLSRYLDAYEEEFDSLQDAIDTGVSNKFIDTADSNSLNEIGELFGPVIGKRRGRTDEQYRVYLKSVVQSFISRGTKSGIKLAISAATDVPIEDIEIRENFQQNSYEVVVLPNTAVAVSLIENVSQIADPSGVEHILTRFPIDKEEIAADDQTIVREPVETGADGTSAEDNTLVDDNKNTLDEQSASDDEARVNDDLLSFLEEFLSDDVVSIDGNLSSSLDDAVVDDTIASPGVRETEPTEIADELFVDGNLSAIVEEAAMVDTIAAPAIREENVIGSEDSVAEPEIRPVTWNGGDWGNLHWDIENN